MPGADDLRGARHYEGSKAARVQIGTSAPGPRPPAKRLRGGGQVVLGDFDTEELKELAHTDDRVVWTMNRIVRSIAHRAKSGGEGGT